MLLAINANNTNVKFGVVDGDRIVGEWRQHTSAMRTADEHAVWLSQLMAMEGIDPKSITDAIIGSVVPQATFNLRRLCTRYFNCEPLVLGEPNVTYGIKIEPEPAPTASATPSARASCSRKRR
jgi:type III pantothenate kinase